MTQYCLSPLTTEILCVDKMDGISLPGSIFLGVAISFFLITCILIYIC